MSPQEKAPAGGNRSEAVRKDLHKKNFTNRRIKNQHLSFAEINQRALPALPALLRRWLPDGVQRGHEYKARNPKRDDHKAGSFSVNVCTGCWADFATGDKGGDVISLAAYLFNLSQFEALEKIAQMLGVKNHD